VGKLWSMSGGRENREKIVIRTSVAVQASVRHSGGTRRKTVRLEHLPME
jgi:hypothetical protein